MSGSPAAREALSEDGQRLLAWLRENYWGGRAPVYSLQEIARGLFPRPGGLTPGAVFVPERWGEVREAVAELERAGLAEQGRLPQGDFGFRLAAGVRC